MGPLRVLTPDRLDKATRFFARHGGKIIIVARFIEGLRQANGIIAGTSGMRWARFLSFNAIGAALWVLVWTSIGYLSGSRIDTIYRDASRNSTYLAIAVGALLVAYTRRMVQVRPSSGPQHHLRQNVAPRRQARDSLVATIRAETT
ncbi:MAG: DedA family protein [Solirubrobacteraceae bacterium]